MFIQRTITICIADDPDLRATLAAFQGVQQRISAACFNDGVPLSALALHRVVYEERTAGRRRQSGLHQPGLLGLWAAGCAEAPCVHLSALWALRPCGCQRGGEHPPSLYCAAAQWAAVNRP
jgi:hypothetical protein